MCLDMSRHFTTGLEAKMFTNVLHVVHMYKNSWCNWSFFLLISFILSFIYLLTWQKISQVQIMGPSDFEPVVHAYLHIPCHPSWSPYVLDNCNNKIWSPKWVLIDVRQHWKKWQTEFFYGTFWNRNWIMQLILLIHARQ